MGNSVGIWLLIGLLVGIFFSALGIFYNWGSIIFFPLALTTACGIVLYIMSKSGS
jgi:hypothetical protein